MPATGSVVIIGGGVVGTACAYYLSRVGWRVTVVERGTVGGACSHGNCGYVCPSHVLPHAGPGAILSTLRTLFQKNSPLKVRPTTVLSRFGWFLNFARKCNRRDMIASGHGIQAILNSSRRLYDQLLERESIPCEWLPNGLLFVFHTAPAFAHYAEVDELLRHEFHLPAERYDAAALAALEPSLRPEQVAGGYLYTGDAQLRPDLLMRGWRQVVETLGGQFREQCEFQGFVEKSDRVIGVKTSHGEIPADAVVVATGAWTPQLNQHLGCRVPIIPGKGYSITMPRPAVCPRLPLIFEEHRVAISPFATGYRIGSTMEFAGYDDSMNRDRLRLLTEGAAFYLKEPQAEPVQEEWWGWRPMVFDGKPIIDRSPKLSNVLIAAGHGMLGLSMATGTGQLISELLCETPPHIDPAPYALSRF